MRLRSLLVLLLSVLSVSVRANDMALGGSGGSPYPVKQQQVSMQSEHIVIRGVNLLSAYQKRFWRVNCRYVFKNHSNQPLFLQVGFPFSVINKGYLAAVPPAKKAVDGRSLIYDFTTTVNQKSVPVRVMALSPSISIDKELNYDKAYVFRLPLEPNKSVVVRHHYTTGVTHHPTNTLGAHYILQTGRLWRGAVIQHAVFDVIPGIKSRLCSELVTSPHPNIMPKPEGLQVKGRGVHRFYHWDLHNFKPRNNLSICLQTAQSFVHQRYVLPLNAPDEFKPTLIWRYNRAQLQFILAAIQAQYGKVFKDAAIQKRLQQQWWYSSRADYSQSRLDEQDKRAMAWVRHRLKRLQESTR